MKKKTQFSEEDLKTAFERQEHKCYQCGKELEFEKKSVWFDSDKKDGWNSHKYFDKAPYNADNCVILCNECGAKYISGKEYIVAPTGDYVIDYSGRKRVEKNLLLGLILAFFLGPIGLIYTNWKVAIIWIFVIALFVGISILIGVGFVIFTPIVCPIYAFFAIRKNNNAIKKLSSKLKA